MRATAMGGWIRRAVIAAALACVVAGGAIGLTDEFGRVAPDRAGRPESAVAHPTQVWAPGQPRTRAASVLLPKRPVQVWAPGQPRASVLPVGVRERPIQVWAPGQPRATTTPARTPEPRLPVWVLGQPCG